MLETSENIIPKLIMDGEVNQHSTEKYNKKFQNFKNDGPGDWQSLQNGTIL